MAHDIGEEDTTYSGDHGFIWSIRAWDNREATDGRRALCIAHMCVVLMDVYGAGEHHLHNIRMILAAHGHWARNMREITYGGVEEPEGKTCCRDGRGSNDGRWIEKAESLSMGDNVDT
jgi:hypothetical protein